MKKRLFLAIPLPENQKMTLNSVKEQNPGADARWTIIENLHITAYFCGDIDESRIPGINDKLQNMAAHQISFKLEWQGLCFAPPKRPPRMVWAEYKSSKEFTDFVHAIYHSIKDYLDPREAERPHSRPIPHITLARFKNPDVAGEIQLAKLDLSPLQVDKFQLIASELTPDGSIYTILHEYEIK